MIVDPVFSRSFVTGALRGLGERSRSRHFLLGGAAAVALLLLVSYSPGADAEWTGVSLNLSNTDSDWDFSGETRQARNSEIEFSIEERTDSGLTVGAAIGYFDMRLAASTAAATSKFDGQYFVIYLRQDFALGERLSLHGGLGLKYASGSESGAAEGDDPADVDWTETNFELGIGLRAGNLRIMPFAAWSEIDGDVSDAAGTSVFSLDRPDTQGIRFDLYTEQSAFVRLEFVTGSRSGGTLIFARRY